MVQGHRFDIIESYGCRPTTYFSIPAIFIVYLPPLLMAATALAFAGMVFSFYLMKFFWSVSLLPGLSLRHFIRRRIIFAAHLSTHSALTTSRYLRLILMSILQMFWSLTATSYTLAFTAMNVPLRPWTTWAEVHSDFSRIDQYPAILIPAFVDRSYHGLWWMIPASTFIFVAFFSFGQDAIEEYKKCLAWLWARILSCKPTCGLTKTISSITSPTYQ